MTADDVVRAYYAAFNAGDEAGFMALLADDVAHDVNQGGRELGKPAFAAFWARMSRCYRERLSDIMVMVDATGTRAAAEFVVHGEYLMADEGLPPAHGQKYVLPAGAFFEIHAGKVARISNYYNLPNWLSQVGG
jgi:steroid delta-isomerase-like uncharacterized protein